MNEDNIRKIYSENEKRYEDFSEVIEALLKKLFKKNSINCDHIDRRVKSIDNVINKFHRKKYSDPFKDMPDIIGLRIIVHYINEIEVIQKLITKEFNIIETINKASLLNSDKFGYSDLHVIVKLNDKRISLSEYNEYTDLHAEIQIRSILQHAWDKLSRQIEYNRTIESPVPLRRKIARLSALLEIADDEFINIKNIKDDIINKYNKSIEKDKLDILLDYESLRIYFKKYFNKGNFNKKIKQQIKDLRRAGPLITSIDTRYFNDFLDLLKRADFKTINDLDKWIKQLYLEKLRIQNIPDLLKSLESPSTLSFDIIQYLCYQLSVEFLKNDKQYMVWMEY